MKVKFKIERYTSDSYYLKKGDIRDINTTSINYCCDEMKEAYGEFIKFGEYDGLLNKDCNLNIFHCSPYPEGACWDACAIKFCPFCGAPIIIEEDKEDSKDKVVINDFFMEG